LKSTSIFHQELSSSHTEKIRDIPTVVSCQCERSIEPKPGIGHKERTIVAIDDRCQRGIVTKADHVIFFA
jgi:hypothetical protein